MEFHEVLYFIGLPRFPTTSWIETMSGKSTKRYYIKVLLTFHVSRHTTKMMKFHEVLYFKALPRFPTTSWTEMKCGNSTKRYYIKVLFTFHVSRHNTENDGISQSIGYSNTSVFSDNIIDWNEVWKINDTLLYKCIIDFSRFTVKHENDKIQRKALVVCCSVFQRTDLWKSRKRE